MPVVGPLEFTSGAGPVVLWVTFTDGADSVTVPAPVMCLEGERGGLPCSDHPSVVQSAVDTLAGLAKDHVAASVLFKIVVSAAQTIAELTADDTSFVWPSLVQRNTAQGGGDAVAGRQ